MDTLPEINVIIIHSYEALLLRTLSLSLPLPGKNAGADHMIVGGFLVTLPQVLEPAGGMGHS